MKFSGSLPNSVVLHRCCRHFVVKKQQERCKNQKAGSHSDERTSRTCARDIRSSKSEYPLRTFYFLIKRETNLTPERARTQGDQASRAYYSFVYINIMTSRSSTLQ